ncbi:MAG: 1-deoxy-D-xylulose-5-phosphate synthase [Streptosporangiaceae bacterium]|nr:1-deoxy-D-xylulose-5-phosphate synthase [Streptosporangiaceae bacterium]
MTLLESINGPEDLKELSQDQLSALASEIRDVLIETVTRTSGHLGPNLGVVELTIALHRVFDSPRDRIVFDTGHQSYVHKLLTGRLARFYTLRQRGGLTGYPSQAESEHDLVENSHASTSLSYADGLAKAYTLRGEPRTVVAVIGDGALTGGMAWEALNNIAAAKDSRLVMVVNDNGWSYQPTIGGLAEHLASIRVSQHYENVLDYIKTTVSRTPLVGPPLYGALHGAKKGLKDFLQPQVMFEDLGIKYVGPIDGHDERLVEHALRRARDYGRPVIVHVITKKGFGYPAAEQNEVDCLHQFPGPSVAAPGSWSRVFGDEMVAIGARRPDVVAITAAMLHPTGLGQFAAAYPDRIYDVGIAEQHALTSAAGLAMGGLHPVVAIYSTFLNRAFDQTLMDVALHELPVTLVLDRAGVTGPDGASHHGMWDGSILQIIPGMRIAAPRDATRVAELLNEAVGFAGPAAVRFPKGNVGGEVEAVAKLGSMDVLRSPAAGLGADVLLLGAGPMALTGLEVADRLAGHGIGVTVVDPRWTKPVDVAVIDAARSHRLVAVVEDNGRAGGFGDAVSRLLRDHDVDVPVKGFGLPQEFLSHGTRQEVLDEAGLTAQHLARRITEAVALRSQTGSGAGRAAVEDAAERPVVE